MRKREERKRGRNQENKIKGGKRERKAAERGKQEVKKKENEWEKNSRKKKRKEGRGKGEEEIRGGQKKEGKKRNASRGLRGGEKKKRRENYILSRKKTSFFEKLNQTHSILLEFTQDHLLTAYHQTKTLISRFFLLMPPLQRNGSFLFVLQSQPFYQAQLVPVTTVSIREAPTLELKTMKRPKSAILPNAACTYDDHFHLGSLARLGEAVCLSRAAGVQIWRYGAQVSTQLHLCSSTTLNFSVTKE